MKFAKYLNEEIKLKEGDYLMFKDGSGQYNGLLVVGQLHNGYIATFGGMIGVYTPKNVNKFRMDQIDACVWIDENGRVEGKYPISKFKGSFEDFLIKHEELWGDY